MRGFQNCYEGKAVYDAKQSYFIHPYLIVEGIEYEGISELL